MYENELGETTPLPRILYSLDVLGRCVMGVAQNYLCCRVCTYTECRTPQMEESSWRLKPYHKLNQTSHTSPFPPSGNTTWRPCDYTSFPPPGWKAGRYEGRDPTKATALDSITFLQTRYRAPVPPESHGSGSSRSRVSDPRRWVRGRIHEDPPLSRAMAEELPFPDPGLHAPLPPPPPNSVRRAGGSRIRSGERVGGGC